MNTPRILVILPFIFCFVAISAEQAADPKQPTLHNGDVPIGSLGSPVGSYLTIEGVRLDDMKTGVHTLRVETVNGSKLANPVAIWVENTDALPKDVHCV